MTPSFDNTLTSCSTLITYIMKSQKISSTPGLTKSISQPQKMKRRLYLALFPKHFTLWKHREQKPYIAQLIQKIPEHVSQDLLNHTDFKLYDNAKKEFQRLMIYMYEPSDSPIASCLVIAPKATAPFIRFCGDYVEINKYIVIGQYPIPNVSAVAFPTSIKSMQSFLGAGLFFITDFVTHFSSLTAPLHDMTKKNFDWTNKSGWIIVGG